jgi:hypothetical protein
MKIDRNNYELFFIDYIDGNLNEKHIDQLLDFLKENPDLASELKGIETIEFSDGIITVPDFSYLKKTDFDSEELFEENCIRVIEGNLSEEEKEQFFFHLKANEHHRQIFQLYKATVLQPDLRISYHEKEGLKKSNPVFILKPLLAVAAIFIFVLFLLSPSKITNYNINNPIVLNIESHPKVIMGDGLVPEYETKKGDRVNTIEKTMQQVILIEDTASKHERLVLYEEITSIQPKQVFAQSEIQQIPLALGLKPMEIAKENVSSRRYLTIEEYLTQKFDQLKEEQKKGLLQKIALNALKKVTPEKVDYSTNENGFIDKIEFSTKLLAISIPVHTSDN